MPPEISVGATARTRSRAKATRGPTRRARTVSTAPGALRFGPASTASGRTRSGVRPSCAKIPVVEVRWTAGVATVRCPVCRRTGPQDRLATVDVDWRDAPIDVVRCRGCGAVVLSAVQPPSSYRDADWDNYIEHVARIEAITDTLVKVGA